MDTRIKQPSLLGTIVRLIGSPKETTELLFDANHRPRHVVTILLLFYITLLAPIIKTAMVSQLTLYRPQVIPLLFVIPTITLVLFIILEKFFLFIFRVRVTVMHTTAAACYSLVPIIVMMLAMYIVNYIINGSSDYLAIMPTGQAVGNPHALIAMKYIFTIGPLLSLCIFGRSLTAITELFPHTAILATVLSIIPFTIALMGAVLISNIFIPDASIIFQQMINSPGSMLGV